MRSVLSRIMAVAAGVLLAAPTALADEVPDTEVVLLSSEKSCDSCCSDKSNCCLDDCGPCYRVGAFIEYLMLVPGDIGFVDAVRQNGVGAGAAPNGPVNALNPNSDSGFRVGLNYYLGECTSMYAAYTWAQASVDNTAVPSAGGGSTLSSLVLFPSTAAASLGTAQIDSAYDIRLQLADFALRSRLAGSNVDYLNLILGGRYGHLDQDYTQVGTYAGVGEQRVDSRIDFDGAGLLLGLESRFAVGRRGFGIYGDIFSSALYGEFTSSYTQQNLTAQTTDAASSWEDQRVVPILQGSLGIDWVSKSGLAHVRIGHTAQYWFNTLITPDYIAAVQNSNYVGVEDTLSLHGLSAMVEFRR